MNNERTIAMRDKSILILAIIHLLTQIGCAAAPKRLSVPLDRAPFEKEYTYSIELKDGRKISNIPGDRMEAQEGRLIVQSGSEERTVAEEQIHQVHGESKRQGSYVWPGFGIGAGVGALTLGLGFALGAKCTGGDECDPILGSKAADILLMGFSGGLLGGLIGLGIGYAIPKKSKVTIVPTVSHTSSEIQAGVGLSLPF
jgi:hypothetical protein